MVFELNTKYIRSCKAKQLSKLHNNLKFVTEKPVYETYDKAIVVPVRTISDGERYGGVFDKANNYVDLSSDMWRFDKSWKPNRDNILHKDKTLVYCGYFELGWGYIFTDFSTRLWFYLNYDDPDYEYGFIVDEGSEIYLNNNFKEYFELLGLADRVKFINKPTQYNKVIIPSLSYDNNKFYTQYYKDTIKRVTDNIKPNDNLETYEKIFLSRSDYWRAKRSEFGLEMIDNFFKKNNFKILHPESLSLSDLIYYIRNADIVATMSGSLQHNMIFANDKSRLIVFERNFLNNALQCDINIIKNLKVTYVDVTLPVYNVWEWLGPVIYAFTKYWKRFCEDYSYSYPDSCYLSYKKIKLRMKKYLRKYKETYAYFFYNKNLTEDNIKLFNEALEDTIHFLGPYIRREKPIFLSEYFSWYFIRKKLKNLYHWLLKHKIK